MDRLLALFYFFPSVALEVSIQAKTVTMLRFLAVRLSYSLLKLSVSPLQTSHVSCAKIRSKGFPTKSPKSSEVPLLRLTTPLISVGIRELSFFVELNLLAKHEVINNNKKHDVLFTILSLMKGSFPKNYCSNLIWNNQLKALQYRRKLSFR